MLEGVNGLTPFNGGNHNVKSGKKIAHEELYSLFQDSSTIDRVSGAGLRFESGKNSSYKEFNDAFKDSALDNKFLDAKTLEAKGWKKSSMMDMNGGVYYTDPKTGASVRVQEDSDFPKSNEFRTENMAHHVYYDENGKATRGILQVKQPDGSIKVYTYEYDVDGNKFIKSVKTSDLDYFASYD